MTLSERVRERLGLSRSAFARLMKTGRQTVYNWETVGRNPILKYRGRMLEAVFVKIIEDRGTPINKADELLLVDCMNDREGRVTVIVATKMVNKISTAIADYVSQIDARLEETLKS